MVVPPKLLIASQGGQPVSAALHDTVEQIAALGWLNVGACARTLLHVAARGRSPLVEETARALAAHLRGRVAVDQAAVLDLADSTNEWEGLPRLALSPGAAVSVRGRRGIAVKVPPQYFESWFVITVATVHADPRWRVSGVLAAQAEVLEHLDPGAPRAQLLVEAHRLAASDLAVACGTTGEGEAWWAFSPSDLLVESAIAGAAGIAPRDLPSIRAIAQHELVDGGELPGVDAGPMLAEMLAVREQGRAAVWRAREDLHRIMRTLRKVPHALRRRIAARFAGGNA